VFQIWRDSLHRSQSYCWETAHRSHRPNFSVHTVGKTMRWIKKWIPPTYFWWSRRALSPCKISGRCYNVCRAGCRCENVVFVTVCLSRSESGAPCVRGCIVRTCIALQFIGRFRRGFQRFHKRLLFQTHYIVLIFVARWRHNFREIAVKNCVKSKNRRKSLCTPLHIDSWEI